MIRVLLDVNIFISYLLNPERDSPIRQTVLMAIERRYRLVLPDDLLDEFVTKIAQKPYLKERIDAEEMGTVVAVLKEVIEEIPRITTEIPVMTRDAKDDYLLAYAIVGAADFLVTGDEDLLVLGTVDTLHIVTPAQFLTIVEGG